MEVNKDEAYRCLDRAQYYISEGDIEKAEKFINKSKRLFPTSEADGKRIILFYFGILLFLHNIINFFLELLQKLKTQGARKQSTSNAKADGQNARKRKNTPPGICFDQFIVVHQVIFISFKGSPKGERANQPTYTKAQLDTVKR